MLQQASSGYLSASQQPFSVINLWKLVYRIDYVVQIATMVPKYVREKGAILVAIFWRAFIFPLRRLLFFSLFSIHVVQYHDCILM